MFSPRLILFFGFLLNYLFYIIYSPEVQEIWPAFHPRPLLLFGLRTGVTVILLTATSFLFVFLFYRLFRLESMKVEAFRIPAIFITGMTFVIILLASVEQHEIIQIANRPNESQEKSQIKLENQGNPEIYPLTKEVLVKDEKRGHPPTHQPQQEKRQTGDSSALVRATVGGQEILIPVPRDHVGGDAVPSHLPKLVPPTQQLLAIFIRYADSVMAKHGVPTTFKTVYRVEVPKIWVDQIFHLAEVEELKREIRSGLLDTIFGPVTGDVNEYYRLRGTKELSEALATKIDEITVGQPVLLGFFDETEESIGVTVAARVKYDLSGRSFFTTVITTLNFVLVQSKLLHLFVARIFESEEDFSQLLSDSKDWAQRFKALNRSGKR